jgi:hypothetical protein
MFINRLMTLGKDTYNALYDPYLSSKNLEVEEISINSDKAQ